jgi:hypothetical protein
LRSQLKSIDENIDEDKMRRKVAKRLRKKSQIVVQIEGTIWRVMVLTGSTKFPIAFPIMPKEATRPPEGLQERFSVAQVDHFAHYENGTMFYDHSSRRPGLL